MGFVLLTIPGDEYRVEACVAGMGQLTSLQGAWGSHIDVRSVQHTGDGDSWWLMMVLNTTIGLA